MFENDIWHSSWLGRRSFDSSHSITQDIEQVYQEGDPLINLAASTPNPYC